MKLNLGTIWTPKNIIFGVTLLALMGFGAYQSFRIGFLEGVVEQQNVLLVETGVVLGRSEENNSTVVGAINGQNQAIFILAEAVKDVGKKVDAAEVKIAARHIATQADMTAMLNRMPQPGQTACDFAFDVLTGKRK